MVPAPAAPRPRLILVDDQKMVVEALARRLGDEFEITGVTYDAGGLIELLRRVSADCVLLDFQLPDRSALELIPELKQRWPILKILVVTMHDDRRLADASLSAGAHGFIPKDASVGELIEAISEVLAGRRYMSPRVPKTSHGVGAGAVHSAWSRLTPREQEIMLLLGEGKRAAQVARILGLRSNTVSFHKRRVMERLGIGSEAGLVRFAVLTSLGGRGER